MKTPTILKHLVSVRIIPAQKQKLELMAMNQGVTITEVLRQLINQA